MPVGVRSLKNVTIVYPQVWYGWNQHHKVKSDTRVFVLKFLSLDLIFENTIWKFYYLCYPKIVLNWLFRDGHGSNRCCIWQRWCREASHHRLLVRTRKETTSPSVEFVSLLPRETFKGTFVKLHSFVLFLNPQSYSHGCYCCYHPQTKFGAR